MELSAIEKDDLLKNAPWNKTSAWEVGELLGAIYRLKYWTHEEPNKQGQADALTALFALHERLSRTK